MKDGTIFTKHTAVRLVNDDEVEMSDGKLYGFSVDVVNHGLIGREDEACIRVGLGIVRQTAHRLAWQKLLKPSTCLIDQFGTVGKKQHLLNPVVAGQQFA